MIPTEFAYSRPASMDEALSLLSSAGGGAKVIAGGMSLLPLLKLRLANVDRLIDIGRIRELDGVRVLADGGIGIGALTTYADLMASPAAAYSVLADALPEIGDVQVRNRGTVGGSVAHADPASDLPACLLALDASLLVRSTRGARTIPVDGFFAGAFQSTLAPDEILVEIRLPGPRPNTGSAYRSLSQPASGFSMVGVAAVVGRSNPGGPVDLVRIGITGVGDHPYRAKQAEAALVGSDGSADAIAQAAAAVTRGVSVQGDIHADAEYRTTMAAIIARRALGAAIARAG